MPMRSTGLPVAASITLRSQEHQFVTNTNLPSGVTATNLGTAPTGITWSMRKVATSTR